MNTTICKNDLRTIIDFIANNSHCIQHFHKAIPTCAIIVDEDNQDILTEYFSIHPSKNIINKSIQVGTIDKISYEDCYFDDYQMIKLGTAIMINVLENDILDIYLSSNILKNYTPLKIPAPIIPGLEIFQDMIEMFHKEKTVAMISIKDVSIATSKENILSVKSFWGTQHNIRSDAYIVLNDEYHDIYAINSENSLPIGYKRVKIIKQPQSKDMGISY